MIILRALQAMFNIFYRLGQGDTLDVFPSDAQLGLRPLQPIETTFSSLDICTVSDCRLTQHKVRSLHTITFPEHAIVRVQLSA